MYLPILLLSALLGATIGEGFTSSEPGKPIHAGYRMFTIHTGSQACQSTSPPEYLAAEPIHLSVGDSFTLSDIVVAAYDKDRKFLPNVPIILIDTDPSNKTIAKDLEQLQVTYVAKKAGQKVFAAKYYCQHSSEIQADLTMIVSDIALHR